MESCPRKEVENFEEKLVEENFYLITEVLLAIRPFAEGCVILLHCELLASECHTAHCLHLCD
jgi:hypothetical protein